MPIKATNDFVWVIRDKPETESGGLIIPGIGREKPHSGRVFSIGNKVTDKDIKAAKNKKALFHKTVGWEIEYQGQVYVLLEERQIVGVDDYEAGK